MALALRCICCFDCNQGCISTLALAPERAVPASHVGNLPCCIGVQAARAADTTDLALEVQQRQDAKSLKLRKQAGKEEAKRLKHAQAVASGEDSKSNVTYQKWGSGGVLEQKEEEVKVEADAEEGVVVDEDEGETGMPEEPLQVCNVHAYTHWSQYFVGCMLISPASE